MDSLAKHSQHKGTNATDYTWQNTEWKDQVQESNWI